MPTLKFKNKRIFITVSIVSAILLAILAFSKNDEKIVISNDPPPLQQVEASYPIHKETTEWDEYTGRFEASNKVDVRARVSGFLSKVNFTDGQYVRKGQILFVIDPQPFRIELDQAQANKEQALATLKSAEADFKRAESLIESGALSTEEYDRRQQVLSNAQASLKLARAKVSDAELNLEYTQVKAPISGLISRRRIDQGNLIDGGSANSSLLTTIVATQPIHFYFKASESDYLKYVRLAKGGKLSNVRSEEMPIEIELADEVGFTHYGTIDFVDNEINHGSGSIELRAKLLNENKLLEPGMFGKARILGSGNYQAVMVPDEIIGTNQSVKYVYVLDAKNTIQAKNVVLGPVHANGMRIIKEGLLTTDRVVVNNLQKIAPGMEVQPTVISLENRNSK